MNAARKPQRPRIQRRPLDGVLLFDKPLGFSSNQALQKIKWLYRAETAGHTGTLDPLATGLLPLAFGEATKFTQGLLEADKRYCATIRFGVTTVTADAEGAVLAEHPVVHDEAMLRTVLARFVGLIHQVPPMYSALKRDGKPLYDYARAGVEVERAPRPVTIQSIELLEYAAPQAIVEVSCSKGTYIRTLAEDIGEALGCGAHLAGLRRTGVGALDLTEAVTLERIEAATEPERDALLAPVDALVSNLPRVEVDSAAARAFGHGQAVSASRDAATQVGAITRVYASDARFLGLATRQPDGRLQPTRVVVQR